MECPLRTKKKPLDRDCCSPYIRRSVRALYKAVLGFETSTVDLDDWSDSPVVFTLFFSLHSLIVLFVKVPSVLITCFMRKGKA